MPPSLFLSVTISNIAADLGPQKDNSQPYGAVLLHTFHEKEHLAVRL